jgi:uncharacterized protein YecT (DUF1311 family)
MMGVLVCYLLAKVSWHMIRLVARKALSVFVCMSRLVVVFVVFIISAPTQSASFDCQQASTSVEKLICSDQELSRKDEELDFLYTIVYGQVADTFALRAAQRKWLSHRNACADADCIATSYRTRIFELEEITAKPAPCFSLLERDWPTVKSGHYPVCVDFLENLNRFCDEPPPTCDREIDPAIKSLSLPKWEELDPKEHLEVIGQMLTPNYRLTKQWRSLRDDVKERVLRGETRFWHALVDLDGDGVDEHVVRFDSDWHTSIAEARRISHLCVSGDLAVVDKEIRGVDVRYEYLGVGAVFIYRHRPYLFKRSYLGKDVTFSIYEPFHEPVTGARNANPVCVYRSRK